MGTGLPSLSKYSHYTDDELVRLVATDPGAYFDAEGEIIRRVISDEWGIEAAIEEHNSSVEQLQDEINKLESENETLRDRVDELKACDIDTYDQAEVVIESLTKLRERIDAKKVYAEELAA